MLGKQALTSKNPQRRRAIIGLLVIFFLLGGFAIFQWQFHGSGHPQQNLVIKSSTTLPIAELSGFAVKNRSEVGGEFYVVGDRGPDILQVTWTNDGSLKLLSQRSFKETLFKQFSPCLSIDQDTCESLHKRLYKQWEAVATDALGRIFILQESTDTIFVFDADLTKVLAVLPFDLSEEDEQRNGLMKVVSDKVNERAQRARGEGLILLKNGHLLVVKQSSPVAIYEFGPENSAGRAMGTPPSAVMDTSDSFVLPGVDAARDVHLQEGVTPVPIKIPLKRLRKWSIPAALQSCDIAEIALGENGSLYALSSRCRQISDYGTLQPDHELDEPQKTWSLPSNIRHPEALIVLGPTSFLVGRDRRGSKTNTYWLEAAK